MKPASCEARITVGFGRAGDANVLVRSHEALTAKVWAERKNNEETEKRKRKKTERL